MRKNTIASLGIAANVIFWPCLFGFAALRPEYSHFTKAVSELGSLDAPRGQLFSVLGFILPGLLLAGFGWGLVRTIKPKSRVLAGLLALSGLLIAVAGVFRADLDHRQGFTTMAHLVGAGGSLLVWILAMIWLIFAAWKTARGQAVLAGLAILATIGAILAGGYFLPGLAQRFVFAAFFGWALVSASLLLASRTRD